MRLEIGHGRRAVDLALDFPVAEDFAFGDGAVDDIVDGSAGDGQQAMQRPLNVDMFDLLCIPRVLKMFQPWDHSLAFRLFKYRLIGLQRRAGDVRDDAFDVHVAVFEEHMIFLLGTADGSAGDIDARDVG